ncbi:MAG: hypothetical protein J6Y94_00110 [Bacteriovoracaceae bacterium]|nr:hypothetical protein [Bacteriovoracaceae bacterium]
MKHLPLVALCSLVGISGIVLAEDKIPPQTTATNKNVICATNFVAPSLEVLTAEERQDLMRIIGKLYDLNSPEYQRFQETQTAWQKFCHTLISRLTYDFIRNGKAHRQTEVVALIKDLGQLSLSDFAEKYLRTTRQAVPDGDYLFDQQGNPLAIVLSFVEKAANEKHELNTLAQIYLTPQFFGLLKFAIAYDATLAGGPKSTKPEDIAAYLRTVKIKLEIFNKDFGLNKGQNKFAEIFTSSDDAQEMSAAINEEFSVDKLKEIFKNRANAQKQIDHSFDDLIALLQGPVQPQDQTLVEKICTKFNLKAQANHIFSPLVTENPEKVAAQKQEETPKDDLAPAPAKVAPTSPSPINPQPVVQEDFLRITTEPYTASKYPNLQEIIVRPADPDDLLQWEQEAQQPAPKLNNDFAKVNLAPRGTSLSRTTDLRADLDLSQLRSLPPYLKISINRNAHAADRLIDLRDSFVEMLQKFEEKKPGTMHGLCQLVHNISFQENAIGPGKILRSKVKAQGPIAQQLNNALDRYRKNLNTPKATTEEKKIKAQAFYGDIFFGVNSAFMRSGWSTANADIMEVIAQIHYKNFPNADPDVLKKSISLLSLQSIISEVAIANYNVVTKTLSIIVHPDFGKDPEAFEKMVQQRLQMSSEEFFTILFNTVIDSLATAKKGSLYNYEMVSWRQEETAQQKVR